MATLLIIFAKEPLPGQVKTRLCPPLAPEAAAQLYHSFLQDILAEMGRLPQLNVALAYHPPAAEPFFRKLAPAHIHLFPQEGGDLGERLTLALARCFALGYGPVLVMGSDVPDLPGRLVVEAKEFLEQGKAEVVLGPAPDGGYYLVGLKAPHPQLFQGLPWSTGAVLSGTLHRARSLSLPLYLLPRWPDIDTYPDLLTFLGQPHPAPAPGWRTHFKARQLLKDIAIRARQV
jgi:uncharacterized protein